MGVVSLKVGVVKQKFFPLLELAHRIVRTPLFKILDPPLSFMGRLVRFDNLHFSRLYGCHACTCGRRPHLEKSHNAANAT